MADDRKIHVVCVHVGSRYDNQYVHKLFNAVKRHMPCQVEYDLTVLTDRTPEEYPDYRVVKAKPGIVNYWHKVTLFDSKFMGFPAGDLVLYMDLDVLVIKSMEAMLRGVASAVVDNNASIVILQDPIAEGRLNSSVMMWLAGSDATEGITYQWESLNRPTKSPYEDSKGDQAWIELVLRSARNCPWATWGCTTVCGYYRWAPGGKAWATMIEPPSECCVVVFHGRPRFHEGLLPAWVMEHWK